VCLPCRRRACALLRLRLRFGRRRWRSGRILPCCALALFDELAHPSATFATDLLVELMAPGLANRLAAFSSDLFVKWFAVPLSRGLAAFHAADAARFTNGQIALLFLFDFLFVSHAPCSFSPEPVRLVDELGLALSTARARDPKCLPRRRVPSLRKVLP